MKQFSLRNQNIIITSNERWGDVWYSKHNYAYELAKLNKVFFINAPGKWQFRNLLGIKVKQKKYSDNLAIIDYNNLLPILNKVLFRINDFLISIKLKAFFKKNKISDTILWSFDPYRLCTPGTLGVNFSLFHSVDLYKFKNYGEAELCKRVNVILCVSNVFVEDYRRFNTPIHVIPHGISSEEFTVEDGGMPEDFKLRNYGLYVGGIDGRINMELLEKILMEFSEIPFLFIGKMELPLGDATAHRIFSERKYKNLYYHEAVHFKKLKYYISKAKFCLAIMDYKHDGNIISHHKILQYLALGKPVFACEMSAYDKEDNLMYSSNDDEGILQLLGQFLQMGEDLILSSNRIKYARKFTFEEILNQVEKIKHK